mmetsp:Transcript_8021/g.29823  ORF Transcript_8021/g.29823 Transcript_8021/m.29823 type:complete len:214 (+) Transcript_8021:275-916(+)
MSNAVEIIVRSITYRGWAKKSIPNEKMSSRSSHSKVDKMMMVTKYSAWCSVSTDPGIFSPCGYKTSSINSISNTIMSMSKNAKRMVCTRELSMNSPSAIRIRCSESSFFRGFFMRELFSFSYRCEVRLECPPKRKKIRKKKPIDLQRSFCCSLSVLRTWEAAVSSQSCSRSTFFRKLWKRALLIKFRPQLQHRHNRTIPNHALIPATMCLGIP